MISPFLVILTVIRALEECGIRYLIGGSVGSSFYGIPRATLDADLVSEIRPEQIDRLVEKLQPEFYIDPEMIAEAIGRRGCFNIIHLKTMFKVDVFIFKDTPYAQAEFSRRRIELIPELSRSIHLASPEDIILTKLVWFKEGGGVSDRQWQDAKGVWLVQDQRLDFAYLEHWAKNLRVADLLEKLKKEISAHDIP